MLIDARIQGSTLRVDVAKTASFYNDSAVVRNSCSCLYCRNFRAVMDSEQGTELRNLLTGLGVDPRKVGDVSEYREGIVNPRAHLYIGWYDLVGEIVARPASGQQYTSNTGLSISFQTWEETQTWVEAPRSPEEHIILSFSVELPWVLPEKPQQV